MVDIPSVGPNTFLPNICYYRLLPWASERTSLLLLLMVATTCKAGDMSNKLLLFNYTHKASAHSYTAYLLVRRRWF